MYAIRSYYDVKEISGIKYIGKFIDNMPAKELKGMADELKKKIGSGVVVITSYSIHYTKLYDLSAPLPARYRCCIRVPSWPKAVWTRCRTTSR